MMMVRPERMGVVGAIAGVVLGGMVATAGCMGDDEPVTTGDAAALHEGFGFHRRHHSPDAGSVGGAAGMTGGGAGPVTGGTTGPGTTVTGGAATDCTICTQAQQCCNALQTVPNC